MEGHGEIGCGHHEEARAIVPEEASLVDATASYSATPQNNIALQRTIAAATWLALASASQLQPSAAAVSTVTSSVPLSSPVSRAQGTSGMSNAGPDFATSNKIIIGACTAGATMVMLLAVAWWLHRRQSNLSRRPRASTMYPPLSPPIGFEEEREKARRVTFGAAEPTKQEQSWVKIDYNQYYQADSPRHSIDSGLGVMLERQPSTTITANKSDYLKAIDFETEMRVVPSTRTPGGPLTSNPPTHNDSKQRDVEKQSIKPGSNPEPDFKPKRMPVMGEGALTARSSSESIRFIEEMQPASPKHREMTPTKSILKKRTHSPPESLRALSPVPIESPPRVASPEPAKSGKKASLKKALGDLIKHHKEKAEKKKEQNVVIVDEEPPKKRKKAVSFGKEMVRRISGSPETEESDWETVNSRSEDGGNDR